MKLFKQEIYGMVETKTVRKINEVIMLIAQHMFATFGIVINAFGFPNTAHPLTLRSIDRAVLNAVNHYFSHASEVSSPFLPFTSAMINILPTPLAAFLVTIVKSSRQK